MGYKMAVDVNFHEYMYIEFLTWVTHDVWLMSGSFKLAGVVPITQPQLLIWSIFLLQKMQITSPFLSVVYPREIITTHFLIAYKLVD
jgi:hypothetical protein